MSTNIHSIFRWFVIVFIAILFGLFWFCGVSKGSTPFTFTINEPCYTSCGVYATGTSNSMLTNLWSKLYFASAGTYSSNWNGNDQFGNVMPDGTYEIRLMQNNVQPLWDGCIGNTSTNLWGPTVHRNWFVPASMSSSVGTNFYCSGYDEGSIEFCAFTTNTPQQLDQRWFLYVDSQKQLISGSGGDNLAWLNTASDGNWVWFACNGTYNPTNQTEFGSAGCVLGFNISNYNVGYFTNGVVITNGPGQSFTNGIFSGTQPGLSGLAVEINGPLLAASVYPDDKVYIYGKYTGGLTNTISVNNPLGLSFGTDSNLWVIASNAAAGACQLLCYTNVGSTPTLVLTVATFSNVLAVACSPSNQNLILVADGNGSQQVEGMNEAGVVQWKLGIKGGMPTNGVQVLNNCFWFSYEGVQQTFLCVNRDGSFWVGDGENHRSLHFASNQTYIDQIMYQPHSYNSSVDGNNTEHVFNQFLQFQVNYTNPIQTSWTLMTNWKVGLPSYLYTTSGEEGLHQVTTLSNGRTYAFVANQGIEFGPWELVELTNAGLRETHVYPFSNNPVTLSANGTVYGIANGTAFWYEAELTGFDANNNPEWGTTNLLATARSLSTDPVPRCCSGSQVTAISSNNILISYDSTLNNGFHFGGVQLGGGSTNWLWENGPSALLNGLGNYQIANVNYGGSYANSVDALVYFGYEGEGLDGGEASQHYLFCDNGLFITEFGEAANGYTPYYGAVQGFAGNCTSPTFVKNNGQYYVWVNDESAHGPQRWHIINAQNIVTSSGFGPLNSTITVTNPFIAFPQNVTAYPGRNLVTIAWSPVAGAASYNVYESSHNGGVFFANAGNTANTSYQVSVPSNYQQYYFVVTAVINGVENVQSEQAATMPYSPTNFVSLIGVMAENDVDTPIDAVNVDAYTGASNQTGVIGSEQIGGMLTGRDLVNYQFGNLPNTFWGSSGYYVWAWTNGTVNSNLASNFTVTQGQSWTTNGSTDKLYNINLNVGANECISSQIGGGVITVHVKDTNFHYLTAVCPNGQQEARAFTLTAACTNGQSASFYTNDLVGLNFTVQYLFCGDLTLTMAPDSGVDGNIGNLQAVFFDTVPVFSYGSAINIFGAVNLSGAVNISLK
jgi:hypothetical protein